ncbi:uncharacterized protein LOC102551177 [Rattus norvegicus]|uniref:uncharacterized protein LOC102551177 n=1 Tax=Rattus norvegicus TaxID=10116 RepID=UPI002FD7A601
MRTGASGAKCREIDCTYPELLLSSSGLQGSPSKLSGGGGKSTIPREDSLENHARSRLIPHKSTVPLYPLHLQVRIQILRQCWQPSHLASPLQSSGSLFPRRTFFKFKLGLPLFHTRTLCPCILFTAIIWHLPCSPVDHYSQSSGITPAVQWSTIPREDSFQIQARSLLIPHKSAVPLYPLHLQVRILIVRQCWQPVIWNHPCGPVDHYSKSSGITPAVQWLTFPREDSLQIQARSPLIPHKSAVPLYPLHFQVRIQIQRQCW